MHTQTDLLHLSVVLIPAGYMIICFYDHLFITTTKEVSAQECTVSTANSRAADGVILRCQLSGDVNTCPALVSAHQATHGGFLNACVRKSPSGDSAMCVIPQISLLFRAEGGREWECGVPRKVMSLTRRVNTAAWQVESIVSWKWEWKKID